MTTAYLTWLSEPRNHGSANILAPIERTYCFGSFIEGANVRQDLRNKIIDSSGMRSSGTGDPRKGFDYEWLRMRASSRASFILALRFFCVFERFELINVGSVFILTNSIVVNDHFPLCTDGLMKPQGSLPSTRSPFLTAK
jgi:hypothetical protein